MDHIGHGTTSFYYIEAPKVPPEEEVLAYEDGLKDTIDLKIKDLVTRAEELIEEREQALARIKDIKQTKGLDEVSEYFVTSWAEIEFTEYHYVQRWLRYWLRLREIVFHTKNMQRIEAESGRITDEQIEQVKEHPLEDLYEGKLRKTGNKLIGRCPFHEEKTASFTIFLNDNHFHCFGCGKHGSPIDFLIYKGKSWRDAIVSLL